MLYFAMRRHLTTVAANQCVQLVSVFVFSSHLELRLRVAWSGNCTGFTVKHHKSLSNLVFLCMKLLRFNGVTLGT